MFKYFIGVNQNSKYYFNMISTLPVLCRYMLEGDPSRSREHIQHQVTDGLFQ